MMGRTHPLSSQNRWLSVSLTYRLAMVDYPLASIGDVLYFIPSPLPITTLMVGVVNLPTAPYSAEIEAALLLPTVIRATFTNSWTRAASVQGFFAAKASASSGDILYTVPMTFSGGTWNVQVSSSTPGIGGLWQAGKAPGKVYVYFNVTDTFGNVYIVDEISLMPILLLEIVDHGVPIVDISAVEDLARQTLDPDMSYELHVFVDVPQGESFTRRVVMYLSSELPTGNSLTAWENVEGVTTLRFSLISATTGDWMVVLPPQVGGSILHWAVYVQDYAGNDNAASLTTSTLTLVYATNPTENIEEPVGYALIGVMAFGLVFAISYRVQQGIQSVKKAKKVSTGVKKAAPGKTIGGTSTSKMPISKDIPTKSCPICKAKIGADLSECPYCHKKF
jgi:hypothetical protein